MAKEDEAGTPGDSPTQAAHEPIATAQTLLAEGDAITEDDSIPPDGEVEFRERYELGRLLGRGGMGEVHLCKDARLGRDVALKTMQADASPGTRRRFLREARLQGRLEHPAIVPVYDLGVAPRGDTYFTMKQVTGVTLERVIRGLAAGERRFVEEYGRRRLLTDFARVCQAVAYAHSRGVVHRDLKPANIMLCEYGEVYVIDWGVAKLRGETVLPVTADAAAPAAVPGQTAAGAVLGTLGYMPPEQLEGAAQVDQRADVYALGAILFELLALAPLHPRTDNATLLRSTVSGADARASERAPDREVPPELEAICVRATAKHPDQRYPDVNALVDDLEGFLDGDRDLQRRLELADEHAARAAAALARAGDDLEARAVAIREAGRALAFDADHTGALRVLTRLLLEPPHVTPPEVERQLFEADDDSSRRSATIGTFSIGVWIAYFAILAWMGVRDWTVLAAMLAVLVVLGVYSAVFARARAPREGELLFICGGTAVVMMLLTRVGGPFVMVPGTAAVTTSMFLLGHTYRVWPLVACGCAAIVVPWALEHAGVLAPSYAFTGDTIIVHANAVSFPAAATQAALMVAAVTTVLMAGLAVWFAKRGLREARRQVLMQAWHLGKLVPPSLGTTAQ
jgi:serine/threonine-protein kinase